MPAPRRYVTDAIVLSRFDLGEADRVLTLITPARRQAQGDREGRSGGPPRASAAASSRSRSCSVALARGRTFDVVTEVHVGHAWLGLRDRLESAATAWYLAELADRSLEERHAAEPLYALLQPRLRAARRRHGARPGRPLVRDAPRRRARPAARGRPLRRVRPDARGDRDASAGCRRWAACCAAAAPARRTDRAGLSLEALKLLKAYQRLDIEAIAALRLRRGWSARSRPRCASSCGSPSSATPRSLAFLDEVRSRHRAAAAAAPA